VSKKTAPALKQQKNSIYSRVFWTFLSQNVIKIDPLYLHPFSRHLPPSWFQILWTAAAEQKWTELQLQSYRVTRKFAVVIWAWRDYHSGATSWPSTTPYLTAERCQAITGIL